jgi:hypothetical protein
MDDNPFAAPATSERVPEPTEGPDDEAIRRAHIAREALVRSIGGLVCLLGIGCVGIGIWIVLTPFQATGAMVLGMALIIAFGALYLAAGMLIRRLHPLGRSIISVLFGLVFLQTATQAARHLDRIAGGQVVILVLVPLLIAPLWAGRARMVFSRRYRLAIVPATPDVRYRTPPWLWLLAGLLLIAVIGAAIAGARS